MHDSDWGGRGRWFYFKDGNLLEIADRDIWLPG